MRTLFLQAPSFEGFDGGAGSRYQAKREIKSHWYPTWLAQLAAMVPDSKLIDAPPHGIELDEVVGQARNFDLAVLHSSTPTFHSDIATARALKDANPRMKIGFVGANVAIDPRNRLEKAAPIDFVTAKDYDFTIRDVAEGKPFADIAGLCYRDANGAIQETAPRPQLTDMDELPFVTPVYQRDLDINQYFIGYLRHGSFDEPVDIMRCAFEAEEREIARTQQVTAEYLLATGDVYRQCFVQEFNFAPEGATYQRELIELNLRGVRRLRFTVLADKSGRGVPSLTALRVFSFPW